MKFGETEIKATAIDLTTGQVQELFCEKSEQTAIVQEVHATVDFFTDSNPKYCTKL